MKNIKTILNITFLIAIISLILMFGINAERLPPISSDPNNWGTILNNYLLREHTGNGTHGNMTAQSLNVSGAVNLATSSGNVGIGTTAPSDKLELANGALRISGNRSDGIALNVSNVLYVDANSSEVGIGTTVPTYKLHVNGAAETTFTDNPSVLSLFTTNGQAANMGGGITFGGVYNAGSTQTSLAYIGGVKENGTVDNYAGRLVFGTRANGSGSASMTKMVIDSAGNVGIGTTGPIYKLHVYDSVNTDL